MTILGIDYGSKKIGLAVSEGLLAEPWKVIRYKKLDIALIKIVDIVKKDNIDKIIVGISEGKMGKETKRFRLGLSSSLKGKRVEIIEWDETLSTHDAQIFSIEAGINRKKRKKMEDAYSAAIILQSFLDRKVV